MTGIRIKNMDTHNSTIKNGSFDILSGIREITILIV